MLGAKANASSVSITRSSGLSRFVPTIYQVTLAAIMGAIFIIALAPRLDSDFWWHLKDGQYIALHHVVPSRDFMSFTMVGHPWTDHEWLAELAMFGLYSLAGLWGPIVAFAFVILATFGFVYARMRSFLLQPVIALFLTAAAFIASSASWGPRIQMMTLLFLSAYLFLLERYRITSDRRLLWAFPAMMLLWANIHGGFVLGPAVLMITLTGEWLNFKTGHPDAWSPTDLRYLAYALAATMAVTIVNPNTYRELLYPLTFLLPNAYTNLIQESASPNFHMPVIMVFEILLLLLFGAIFVARPRINWTHLFLILAFTHLALSQVRNVAVWAVVIGPLVALYLQRCGPALREQFPRFSYTRRPVSRSKGAILNATLLSLVAVAYALEGTHFVNATTLRQAENGQYPRGAIAYMATHRLPSHVYASYTWGGYLLWYEFPRYRDYMDSRADTLYNTRILKGYVRAYGGRPGWAHMLDANKVGSVLIEPSAPLAQLLALDRGWRLAYRDSVSVLYVRK